MLLEEVGLEAQWQLYHWLSQNCDRPPMVVEAETVQRDPVVCHDPGLELSRTWRMKPDAFQWDANSTAG